MEKIGSEVLLSIPVLDTHGRVGPSAERRQRPVPAPELFIVDITDRQYWPFVGEVIATTERGPVDGDGVVALVGEEVGGWTFRRAGRESAPYLVNWAGDEVASGYEILGVITRVVTVRSFN